MVGSSHLTYNRLYNFLGDEKGVMDNLLRVLRNGNLPNLADVGNNLKISDPLAQASELLDQLAKF